MTFTPKSTGAPTFSYLRAYTWRRVVCWLRRKHPKANWRWLMRRYLPRWWPTDGDTVLYDPGAVRIEYYRYTTGVPESPRKKSGRRCRSGRWCSS
jgi:hypothetical protein